MIGRERLMSWAEAERSLGSDIDPGELHRVRVLEGRLVALDEGRLR